MRTTSWIGLAMLLIEIVKKVCKYKTFLSMMRLGEKLKNGPVKPTEAEQHDILELLHRRRKESSTIFCSQH